MFVSGSGTWFYAVQSSRNLVISPPSNNPQASDAAPIAIASVALCVSLATLALAVYIVRTQRLSTPTPPSSVKDWQRSTPQNQWASQVQMPNTIMQPPNIPSTPFPPPPPPSKPPASAPTEKQQIFTSSEGRQYTYDATTGTTSWLTPSGGGNAPF